MKKKEYELSSLDMEQLLRQLKLELGIENSGPAKTKIQVLSESHNTNTLSDLMTSHKHGATNGKALYPPAPPHRWPVQIDI